ncbi:MAG TPA: glycosyl hydrolase [Chloroflexota bacterium]|nr:glycosyl hydrolase [Chloroflexota bacterium]
MQLSNAERALAAYEAMQRWLYVADGRSLYRESHPWSGNPYAYVWPFSRALLGTSGLAGMPGGAAYAHDVADRLAGLERYWNDRARVPAYASYPMPPLGQGGDRYYDDNVWLALTFVQLQRMGLVSSLQAATQLLRFGLTGWDREPRHPQPGGVFWVEQGVGYGRDNHDRGTGATAGNAELGYLLGTREASDEMLGWVQRSVDASGVGSGPFFNVVRLDGTVDTNVWSYNQGVMLGTHLARYRLTSEAADLRLAEEIARQTLRTFGDFRQHPPSFNAMCFQSFLHLSSITSDDGLRAAMRGAADRFADWAWATETGARDPQTNLFFFDDAGRPALGKQAARLQDQGALVQLYALLAWDPDDYVKLG